MGILLWFFQIALAWLYLAGAFRGDRDGGRDPAGRPGRHQMAANIDPTRRGRSRRGNPLPGGTAGEVFARDPRLERRHGARGRVRGLRALRARTVGLATDTTRSRPVMRPSGVPGR